MTTHQILAFMNSMEIPIGQRGNNLTPDTWILWTFRKKGKGWAPLTVTEGRGKLLQSLGFYRESGKVRIHLTIAKELLGQYNRMEV
jgi:hypothetical protein